MLRKILHSDLNAFYASVEMLLNPRLRGKAVAVCGSEKERCGIVLAKSEAAKACGIKTGMRNFEARRLCRDLIIVPPRFEEYLKFSRLARQIYLEYSDCVEPFGMDECWIDLSRIPYPSMEIAEKIRRRMAGELGLTASIGVSFNKVFAKLGSDLKKPDAISEITPENFKERLWPLPASDMIYVGPKTKKVLEKHFIYSIGDLAKADPAHLSAMLGMHGRQLWLCANGRDESPVTSMDALPEVKSVGRGVTLNKDAEDEAAVWQTILYLSCDVARRLRQARLKAGGIRVSIKSADFFVKQFQRSIALATQNEQEIAHAALSLWKEQRYPFSHVRAVTVCAIQLRPESEPEQIDFFHDLSRHLKRSRLDAAADKIHGRFGKSALKPASLLLQNLYQKNASCETLEWHEHDGPSVNPFERAFLS